MIHAKDYGVPQNRPRVFIIGLRSDINFNINKSLPASGLLPIPDKSYPHPEELLSDLIDRNYNKGFVTKYYLSDPKNIFQKRLRLKMDGKSFFKKPTHQLLITFIQEDCISMQVGICNADLKFC